jgi:hypothetical protein
MTSSVDKKLNLAALNNGMPGLTPAGGTVLAEAAAVCLEERNHHAGVKLTLLGISKDAFQLEWKSVDEQQRRCYNDLQEATEKGACGVAILLAQELTGKVVVERSKKGPGFDYWLGDSDDDLLFVGKARLEVSGILLGSSIDIQMRVKQKKAQMKPSHQLAPGYVAVVEFGTPTAHVETP